MKIIKTFTAWRIERLGNKLLKIEKEIEQIKRWRYDGIGMKEELEWLEGYCRVEAYGIGAKLAKLRRKYETTK